MYAIWDIVDKTWVGDEEGNYVNQDDTWARDVIKYVYENSLRYEVRKVKIAEV